MDEKCNFGRSLSFDKRNCILCSNSIPNCVKCVTDEYGIIQNGCIECESGYILNVDYSKCLKCSMIDKECVECELKFNSTEIGRCKKCKYGFILSYDGLSCKKCPDNCLVCNPDGSCTLCNDNFALDQTDRTKCLRCPLFCRKCRYESNSKECKICLDGHRLNKF